MDSIILKDKEYKIKKYNLILKKKDINEIGEILGLESLTYLSELNLRKNNIHRIEQLNPLKNLRKLVLSRNQISEISNVKSLTNLEVLDLKRNKISEIKGLETLTNLRELNLIDNEIEEIKEKFGFDPREVGNRHRGFWIIEEIEEEEAMVGAGIGDLCIKTRDGGGNPPDCNAGNYGNYIGTSQDGFDLTYRYYYYREMEGMKK